MRLQITFFFSFFAIALIGQNSEYNYFWDWEFQKSQYLPIQYEPSQNVSQINYTVMKKGKETRFVKKYDDAGKLLGFSELDKNSISIPIGEFEYDENGKLIVSKTYKKGNFKYVVYKTYDENGGMTSLKKEKENGKVLLSNVWEYNADKCLINSTKYKGNGKVDKRWEYTYYDACKKSKTTLLNGKGKVKNTWVYDCKDEGEVLEKKKDETQVCKWDELSKDYLIRVYQTYDEKGRMHKNVSKYTLADTLIVETSIYDSAERMTYHATYDKYHDRPLVTTRYRKGKKVYEHVYEYENGEIVSHTFSHKDKLRSKYEYTYISDLLTELKVYDKKGGVMKTTKLSYGKSVAMSGH